MKHKKADIINTLYRDKQATAAGFLIAVSGELYRTVSCSSIVYIEYVGDIWQVWRETYKKDSPKPLVQRPYQKAQSLTWYLQRRNITLILSKVKGAKSMEGNKLIEIRLPRYTNGSFSYPKTLN